MDEEALEQACSAAEALPRAWVRAGPGEILRAVRSSRRVSQRHLAEVSGVRQSFISRLERGGDARWGTWRRLFSALGFDLVMAPLASCEDAEDFLKDQAQHRKDRAEAGRQARW
jgi:transcriptional regulator with XRE-family HTH domain